ncbi:MAG TPA: transglutaminase domain-containing protein [Chitinophagaceae bacterium]|nr:transglutaminase domain-containing protein [Chitinophagaceae bacterium]
MLLICGFLGRSAGAQSPSLHFSSIDHKAMEQDDLRPDSLAYKLTAPFTSELEKTRAIFRWITGHIAYRTRLPFSRSGRYAARHRSETEDSVLDSKPLNERVAYEVLRDREAVCDGYARLFKTLCDYAGIRSELVTGYVRTGGNRPGSFRSNHTWNAVRIDSTWYLADATWASGYITYLTEEFVRSYDDFYFLTPPDQLIRSHFPEDVRWTLLPQTPTVREFQQTPFKCMAFSSSQILRFFPSTGIIEATVGDSVRIELETVDADKKMMVYTGLPLDSARFSTPIPDTGTGAVVRGRNISYTFYPATPGEDWLNVVYNNYTVLRYRLRIRPRPQPVDSMGLNRAL